jgi:hypothetical protein
MKTAPHPNSLVVLRVAEGAHKLIRDEIASEIGSPEI